MSWLGEDKDWFPPAQRKVSPVKTQEDKKKLNQAEPENEYAVSYVSIRCPNKKCQSKDIKCYTSTPPIRYHFCRACGLRFKSVEQ